MSRGGLPPIARSVAFAFVALAAAPALASRLAVVVPPTGDAAAERTAAVVAATTAAQLATDLHYEVVTADDPVEPLRARDELIRARSALAEGAARLEALLPEEATERLRAALAGFRANVAYLESVAPVAEALLHLAALDLLVQDSRSASRRIADAYALNPSIKPDPRVWNPPMQARFRQVVEGRAARGKLVVEASSPDVVVFVDGVYRGVTPLELEVAAGERFVRLSKVGFAPWGKVTEVKVGTTRVRGALQPLKRRAEIERALAEAAKSGEARADAVEQIAQLHGADMVLLVSAKGSSARVELWSGAHAMMLRSAEVAASGAAPDVTPALRALVPPRSSLVVFGGDVVPADPPHVASGKQALSAGLARLGANATFVPQGRVDAGCAASGECLASRLGVRPDGVLHARFASGKAAGVELELVSLHSGEIVHKDQLKRAALELEPAALGRALARALGAVWASAEVAKTIVATVQAAPVADESAAAPSEGGVTATLPADTPRVVAYSAIGGGAALFLAGLALSVAKAGVLEDATSTGDEKERARTAGRLGVVGAGVGLVGAALGGIYLWRAEAP